MMYHVLLVRNFIFLKWGLSVHFSIFVIFQIPPLSYWLFYRIRDWLKPKPKPIVMTGMIMATAAIAMAVAMVAAMAEAMAAAAAAAAVLALPRRRKT